MRQVGPHEMRRDARGTRPSRVAPAVAILCLFHVLSGCVLESVKPELALDTPAKYLNAHGAADAAVPKLDWWRGFIRASWSS